LGFVARGRAIIADQAVSMLPTTSYIICFTPRCGSTLLCRLLENTQMCGRPEEFYWRGDGREDVDFFQARDHADLLEKIYEFGSTANGVFGVKIGTGEYMAGVLESLRSISSFRDVDAPPELLRQAFPNLHYIWVTRRNKVRHAISWLKASQTS